MRENKKRIESKTTNQAQAKTKTTALIKQQQLANQILPARVYFRML
jgi:hypothetical protein